MTNRQKIRNAFGIALLCALGFSIGHCINEENSGLRRELKSSTNQTDAAEKKKEQNRKAVDAIFQ